MKRLKVLISAYACEPDKGSEPEVGWRLVEQMSQIHDVWVITRSNNKDGIEAGISSEGEAKSATFIYHDLPSWMRWWKHGRMGVRIYYGIWQASILFLAFKLHRRLNFDIVHHVTFAKYWSPSYLPLLPVPFVWGPVGGGESTPRSLVAGLSVPGRWFNTVRGVARFVGEANPMVRYGARKSSFSLATTQETARRLTRLGATRVKVISQLGFSTADLQYLHELARTSNPPIGKVRFICAGNLLALKGFHLALQAFAEAGAPSSELVIVGSGPERDRLNRIAASLAIRDRVVFLGRLTRDQTLTEISNSHVLVHPSLHDSGAFVCLEAMALGKPVICLDSGGPAMQVTSETGFKIPISGVQQTVADIADAITVLSVDPLLRGRKGAAGRARVQELYDWSERVRAISDLYHESLAR